MRQGDRGVRLEPLLEAISAFLDDQRDVIECIRRDLVRGLKQPGSGRHGLTATQVLRSLVLMRLKNTLASCANALRMYDAFQRGFIRLTPQRLKAVNEQQTDTYRVLIDIAEEVVGNARAGLERTRTMRGKDMFTDMAIEELRGQIEHFCGLGDRVIDQARRRVLFGEQVATDEKIYSIFEPHTDLIKRGKVRTPVVRQSSTERMAR